MPGRDYPEDAAIQAIERYIAGKHAPPDLFRRLLGRVKPPANPEAAGQVPDISLLIHRMIQRDFKKVNVIDTRNL